MSASDLYVGVCWSFNSRRGERPPFRITVFAPATQSTYTSDDYPPLRGVCLSITEYELLRLYGKEGGLLASQLHAGLH